MSPREINYKEIQRLIHLYHRNKDLRICSILWLEIIGLMETACMRELYCYVKVRR